MKKPLTALAVVLAAPAMVHAGGLDRSGQPIGIIFEKGNYAEFTFSHTNPSVTGSDVPSLNPAQTPTGNVARSFNQVGAGLKYQFNDNMSFSLLYDQPWGSDVSYAPTTANPTTPGSVLLGGTQAFADSHSITGILRYSFNDRWSAHGGLRWQRTDGRIQLRGLAYGLLNGYNVSVAPDNAAGWLVGGAFEIPEIALRVALTYQSEVTHKFRTTETVPGLPGVFAGQTETKTPQSVNLDFQTGVATDTLVFGSIRWADHSATKLRPPTANVDLIDLKDSTTYNLGVARRLNDNWAASISFGYEAEDSDNLVSPLAPTNGFKSVSLGLQYTQNNIKVSGGVRYTKLGDAFAETGTPDVARSSFSDNDAVSFGLRVGVFF